MKVSDKIVIIGASVVLVAGVVALGISVGGNWIEKDDPDAKVVTVEDTSLDNAAMEEALKALAARMQNQLRANDATSTVKLVENEDGSCKIEIYSNGVDSDVETYPSIEDCFASYLEAGFFDSEGNVRGFSEQIPDADTTAEDEEAAESAALEVIAGTPMQNEDNLAAGFPGEGKIDMGTETEDISLEP